MLLLILPIPGMADSAAEADGGVEPAPSAEFQEKGTPSELLTELLRPRTGAEPPGRFLTLESALCQAANWRKGVEAYWNLVDAYARLHIAGDDRARLARLGQMDAAGASIFLLKASLARAEADHRTAELNLLQAQRNLAELLAAPSEDLALPEDQPHAGRYDTRYAVNFPAGGPSNADRIQLALAGQYETIDLCREGVLSAEEALRKKLDEFRQQQAPLESVLLECKRLTRAQRTFVTAVTRYNVDIAEYVHVLYGPSIRVAELLPMLIQQGARGGSREGGNRETTAGSAPDGVSRVEPVIRARPTWTDARPPEVETSDLVSVDKPLRAQRLVLRLHAARDVSGEPGECALTLLDCFRCVDPADWGHLARDYWKISELSMKLGVAQWRLRAYEIAGKATLDATGPDRDDLESGLAAAQASLSEWGRQLEIVQAEFGRKLRLGVTPRMIDPITAPHGGRYSTHLAEIPSALADRHDVLRGADLVQKCYGIVEERATAVVYLREHLSRLEGAPAARALTARLAAIDEAAAAAASLLESVAAYNAAIAEYALAVLPPGLTPEQVVQSLVLEPAPKSSSIKE